MRIAFFTDAFYPHIDGVTTYVGVATRALIAAGHEVLVVAPKWDHVSESSVQNFVPGAKVVLVPGVKPFFYPSLKLGTPTPQSINEVRKFSPDIIHFHTPGFTGFEAMALSKLLKVPLVNTFHTYYMEPEGFAAIGLKENSVMSKMLQESLWKISEQIHKPCDVVIAPTEYVGKDLKHRWPKVNIQVIPGAVELKAFGKHTHRHQLRQQYRLDQSIVFLSVGRLSAEKHFDVLITAFSMILIKYPKAKLVFIGDGTARTELEYIVKVLGIEHAVVFLGAVPYQTITQENYYDLGDVFVSPSTWDTQGLSIVEAMASGLPTVAFKCRAMPEVIGSGGLLVPQSDQYGFAKAMSKLAGNPKLRDKLGQNAIVQSQKYQVDTHLKKLLALYQSLIN